MRYFEDVSKFRAPRTRLYKWGVSHRPQRPQKFVAKFYGYRIVPAQTYRAVRRASRGRLSTATTTTTIASTVLFLATLASFVHVSQMPRLELPPRSSLRDVFGFVIFFCRVYRRRKRNGRRTTTCWLIAQVSENRWLLELHARTSHHSRVVCYAHTVKKTSVLAYTGQHTAAGSAQTRSCSLFKQFKL